MVCPLLDLKSCGRIGGGASIGLRATASAGQGDFSECNSATAGVFGTVGHGVVSSVSTETGADGNTSATVTLDAGAGAAGGAQACATRSFCY